MHNSIDKVLEILMAARGLKQIDLARETSVNQSTISRILKPNGPKGIKEPTDKQVRPLADYFGVTTDQLRGHQALPAMLGGDLVRETKAPRNAPLGRSAADIVKAMLSGKAAQALSDDAVRNILRAAEQSDSPAPADQTNVIVADFSRRALVGDEIRIAHYDVQGAMGNGKQVHDFPELFRDVTVSQQHLRELGVKYQDPRHLKMITGDGQSMAPTIQDKDPMIVDASIREFTGDGIYAFTWEGLFYIKRLQKKGSDHFKMISDNAQHDTEVIPADQTYIQARVLLVWNAKRV